MAKITNYLGELSGKLGGLVYARNKAGAYVRSYATPTNPRSGAQLALRAAFTSAVTSWHALGDTIKAQWNQYAITNFKPKYPVIGVRYSGFNAWVSLKNQMEQAIKTAPTASLSNGMTGDPLPFNTTKITPPNRELSSSIMVQEIGPTEEPGVITIHPLAGQINLFNSSFSCSFRCNNIIANNSDVYWRDAQGEVPVGILLMASVGNTQAQQFVKEPKYTILGVLPPQENSKKTITNDTFEIVGGITNNGKKLEWNEYDIVEINAFLISEQGATQPLGSTKVQVVNQEV